MKMKSTGIAIALCAIVSLGTSAAQAAMVFCVTIVGQKQGALAATSTRRGGGCVGKIEASGFSYGMVSPRDMTTGLSTGRRQHKPIRIKKEWSAASIQLFRAMEENELLTMVTLDFFSVDQATGQMLLDHSINLTNAFITSIEHSSEVLTSTEAASKLPPMETLELTFQKIELIDHKSKTMAVSENSERS
jgi:type VI secretion system secreted protein Hcp